MNEDNLYILLDVILKNGSPKRLLRQGMSFKQIAEYINKVIELNFVSYINEKITLTDLGVNKLKQLESYYKKTNKNEWIDKDIKNKTLKIEKDFLYLPNQNELTF